MAEEARNSNKEVEIITEKTTTSQEVEVHEGLDSKEEDIEAKEVAINKEKEGINNIQEEEMIDKREMKTLIIQKQTLTKMCMLLLMIMILTRITIQERRKLIQDIRNTFQSKNLLNKNKIKILRKNPMKVKKKLKNPAAINSKEDHLTKSVIMTKITLPKNIDQEAEDHMVETEEVEEIINLEMIEEIINLETTEEIINPEMIIDKEELLREAIETNTKEKNITVRELEVTTMMINSKTNTEANKTKAKIITIDSNNSKINLNNNNNQKDKDHKMMKLKNNNQLKKSNQPSHLLLLQLKKIPKRKLLLSQSLLIGSQH